MVTHPKGIKSPVHPFENWKIHPEDFVGNVSPTKSLVARKPNVFLWSIRSVWYH